MRSFRLVAAGRDTTYLVRPGRGTPIGGPHSGTVSKVVLCGAEHKKWFDVRNNGVMRLRRYGDDILCIARLCRRCIESRIAGVYPHPFEIEKSNFGGDGVTIDESIPVEWMDYKLSPDGRRIEVGEAKKADYLWRVPGPGRGQKEYENSSMHAGRM